VDEGLGPGGAARYVDVHRQDAIDALTIAAWSDPANAEAKQLLDSVR